MYIKEEKKWSHLNQLVYIKDNYWIRTAVIPHNAIIKIKVCHTFPSIFKLSIYTLLVFEYINTPLIFSRSITFHMYEFDFNPQNDLFLSLLENCIFLKVGNVFFYILLRVQAYFSWVLNIKFIPQTYWYTRKITCTYTN